MDPRTYRFGSGVPWSHMISSCGSSVNACNVTDTIFGTHLLLNHAVFCIRHVTYTIPPLCSEGFGRRMQLLYYTTCARTRTRYRLSTRYVTTLVASDVASEATYDRTIFVHVERARIHQLTLPKLPGAFFGPTQHLAKPPSFTCNMRLCPYTCCIWSK